MRSSPTNILRVLLQQKVRNNLWSFSFRNWVWQSTCDGSSVILLAGVCRWYVTVGCIIFFRCCNARLFLKFENSIQNRWNERIVYRVIYQSACRFLIYHDPFRSCNQKRPPASGKKLITRHQKSSHVQNPVVTTNNGIWIVQKSQHKHNHSDVAIVQKSQHKHNPSQYGGFAMVRSRPDRAWVRGKLQEVLDRKTTDPRCFKNQIRYICRNCWKVFYVADRYPRDSQIFRLFNRHQGRWYPEISRKTNIFSRIKIWSVKKLLENGELPFCRNERRVLHYEFFVPLYFNEPGSNSSLREMRSAVCETTWFASGADDCVRDQQLLQNRDPIRCETTVIT
jgi:hypothetical protein